MYFRKFVIIYPCKNAWSFIWTKLNFLYPRMLCAMFGCNWPSGFKVSSMYLRYIVIISPWKSTWPCIWTNLNPRHPKMLCAKFGWNWPNSSGKEDENAKRLQTDGWTVDDTRSEKLTQDLSSGDLKINTW